MRPILAKILKKDKVVIRKTDNEVTRLKKYFLREYKQKEVEKGLEKESKILESRSADIK